MTEYLKKHGLITLSTSCFVIGLILAFSGNKSFILWALYIVGYVSLFLDMIVVRVRNKGTKAEQKKATEDGTAAVKRIYNREDD